MELFSDLDISDHLSAFLAQGPLLAFSRVGKSINYVYRSAILFARKRGDEARDSFSARVVRTFSSLSLSLSLVFLSLAFSARRASSISFSRLFSRVCARVHRTERERPVTDGRRGGGRYDPVRLVRITFVTIARLNNLETCIRGVAERERKKERRRKGERNKTGEKERARARAVTDGFTIGPRR